MAVFVGDVLVAPCMLKYIYTVHITQFLIKVKTVKVTISFFGSDAKLAFEKERLPNL